MVVCREKKGKEEYRQANRQKGEEVFDRILRELFFKAPMSRQWAVFEENKIWLKVS